MVLVLVVLAPGHFLPSTLRYEITFMLFRASVDDISPWIDMFDAESNSRTTIRKRDRSKLKPCIQLIGNQDMFLFF